MRRREFIGLIGGVAATWPLAAHAQQGGRMRRVGILMPFSPSDAEMQDRVQALKKELQNRCWTAGVNIQFDERWTTDNMDLVRANAANLVELKPDVIVAIGGRVILAPHMSAFGCKADMPIALQNSAFDPKLTSQRCLICRNQGLPTRCPAFAFDGEHRQESDRNSQCE